MNDTPKAVHLGDGAYVSQGSYHGELVFTANHHDRELATDTVVIGPSEVEGLVLFMQQVGYHIELTCPKKDERSP